MGGRRVGSREIMERTMTTLAPTLEANVFKIAVGVARVFQSAGLPVKMVVLLHDGIWFTCPEGRATVARVKESIQEIMENSVRLSVPLKFELVSQANPHSSV